MEIDVSPRSLTFFEALSSETRLRMVQLLADGPRGVGELAQAVGISAAMATKHVQILEKAGVVLSENIPGKRGTRKLCSLRMRNASLVFGAEQTGEGNTYDCTMPVGQYRSYEVWPTCGLASAERIIGAIDDPRYFADPEHVRASMVWFGSGYVEYGLPNYLLGNEEAVRVRISLEICSEAPGFNENWPSDITFSVNGKELGVWTSPGDFGERRGGLTPAWWPFGTQYGLLKTITVDGTGSYLDGLRLSGVTVGQLGLREKSAFVFRVENKADAVNRGGVSIFGRDFGNYGQDIAAAVTCRRKRNAGEPEPDGKKQHYDMF